MNSIVCGGLTHEGRQPTPLIGCTVLGNVPERRTCQPHGQEAEENFLSQIQSFFNLTYCRWLETATFKKLYIYLLKYTASKDQISILDSNISFSTFTCLQTTDILRSFASKTMPYAVENYHHIKLCHICRLLKLFKTV